MIADTPYGRVRAGEAWRANFVGQLLEEHYPRVLSALPDTDSPPDLEVWLQESPALYRMWHRTHDDADGFWADGPGRIHLRERADNLERTLVHELVHACLGESWERLPGSLEEGLCDVVSSRLCPDSAARLRAGRLSSAAFATGGLGLELEVTMPAGEHPYGLEVSLFARAQLLGNDSICVDPNQVFEINAGLSSTHMDLEGKKAFYGLSFLVVERIADRIGFEGLNELCARARAEKLDEVPDQWLLDAAGLTSDHGSWRQAIVDSLGVAELAALVRMHPNVMVDVLMHHVRSSNADGSGSGGSNERDTREMPQLRAKLSLPGGRATLCVTDIQVVREGLSARW